MTRLTPFHFAFPVDDLAAARHFYGEVIGCREGRSSDKWIDFDLFGHQIKKGDKLILWYISANRDESVFDDGDALKLDRGNARRHLSFGYGVHRCVGARLAELQLRILLEEMAARRMRVKVTGEPERVHACFVHGFRALPVQIEKY